MVLAFSFFSLNLKRTTSHLILVLSLSEYLSLIDGSNRIYDPNPSPALKVTPGALPTQIDPPLRIPAGSLPKTTAPSSQERFEKTPVYEDLT